ncbi:MAG: SPFH domain-containing protein [Candidatus Heimdallarchaeota archaeon]|nr:SPFH domain-containing protein [Candidatus Heimdallarchaeota archaeon]
MVEVLEWPLGRGDEIMYRHPRDTINWGDQVNVLPNQVAVFIKDSVVYDVLKGGRHFMKTKNIPLLTTFLSRIVGFDKSPFNCQVIFVNLADFQGKFGGRSQTQELAPLQFFGDYYYKIDNIQKFVFEIAGNRSIYTTASFNEFFRTFVVESVISKLSEKSITDVMSNLGKTSDFIEDEVKGDLLEMGIKLKNLKFGGIDTTPEYRDRLFWMRSGVAAQDIQQYAGMAKVVEKMPEGGSGLTGAVMINNLFSRSELKQADKIEKKGEVESAFITCNQCKNKVSPAAKFCANCGDPTDDEKKGEVKFCTECGAKNAPDVKFCGNCGHKY